MEELPGGSDKSVALGRKGLQTRRKLLDAAHRLLEQGSPVGLTTSAIATSANLSPASFYNYFADVNEVIYLLSLEATERSLEILEAVKPERVGFDSHAVAEGFVKAYRDFWKANRPILSIRNMEADRGNQKFMFIRRKLSDQTLDGLLEIARRVRRLPFPGNDEALRARLAVVIAAIERLAAVEPLYEFDESYPSVPLDALREAEVGLLAAILDPQIVYDHLTEVQAHRQPERQTTDL